MADDTFSGAGGDNTDQATTEQVFPGFADLLAKVPTTALTPDVIPTIFQPAAQTDNAAALTKMITDLTGTPEKLAAFTDLVAFISKFKAA